MDGLYDHFETTDSIFSFWYWHKYYVDQKNNSLIGPFAGKKRYYAIMKLKWKKITFPKYKWETITKESYYQSSFVENRSEEKMNKWSLSLTLVLISLKNYSIIWWNLPVRKSRTNQDENNYLK